MHNYKALIFKKKFCFLIYSVIIKKQFHCLRIFLYTNTIQMLNILFKTFFKITVKLGRMPVIPAVPGSYVVVCVRIRVTYLVELVFFSKWQWFVDL